MNSTESASAPGWLHAVWRWFAGWWFALFLGAQLAVLAFSPSSYRHGAGRAVLRHVYAASGPGLPGFTILMALFNVVVIRIMVVTAGAYGLAPFAIDAVVRVLVLELIPLVAALFVAVNYTIPAGSELYRARQHGRFRQLAAHGLDPLSHEVLPRVLAGLCAVVLLAAVSCVLSLFLAYFAIYGWTLAGLPAYSRKVGQIFNFGVTLIFTVKTALFALTVALLPVVHGLSDVHASRGSVEVRGLMQMFVLMLLIQVASLIGNYY